MADTKKNIFEDIDENSDQRLLDLQTEYEFAVGDVSDVYNSEISKNEVEKDKTLGALDKAYQAGVNELNTGTDAVVSGLEEKKDEAEDSYDIEAKAAYTDWQKASDPYGVNAEQMASMGMSNTGYSETAKVAMYNQYQNRVAVARATFNKATADYDRAIADAKAQNSVALARLASETYLKQAELSLYFVQKNDELLASKEKAIEEVNAIYATKWQDVLKQIKEEEDWTIRGGQGNFDNPLNSNTLNEARRMADYAMRRPLNPISNGNSNPVEEETTDNSTKVDDSELEIDTDSIIALGYGSISPKRLEELIRSGEVIEIVNNGKVSYVKAPVAPGRK